MDNVVPFKNSPANWTLPVLSACARWFRKCFAFPTKQNESTQTGVHFEEVAEMLDEMEGTDPETFMLIENARHANHELAERLKATPGAFTIRDRTKFLDALCDQIVTATGTAHMFDMDIVGGMAETNRENYSKFDLGGNPIFNQTTGKVMKGPNYKVSDLTPFV